jgi:hypothetical protein
MKSGEPRRIRWDELDVSDPERPVYVGERRM